MHACLFFFTPLPYSSSLMSSPLPPFLLPRPRASEVWPGHCLGQGSSHCSKLVSVGAPLIAHVHCAGAAAAVRSARPAVPVGAASSPSLSPPLHSPGVLLPPLRPTCWRSLFCAACTAAPSCTFCCWHTASDCALASAHPLHSVAASDRPRQRRVSRRHRLLRWRPPLLCHLCGLHCWLLASGSAAAAPVTSALPL